MGIFDFGFSIFDWTLRIGGREKRAERRWGVSEMLPGLKSKIENPKSKIQ
jgi:hypothetical protein